MDFSKWSLRGGVVAAAFFLVSCGGRPEASPVTLPAGGSPEVAAGAALARGRACTSCHTLDGGRASGPTWKGILGAQRTLTDGRQLTIDHEYLRRAIVEPESDVPKGYSGKIMANVLKNQEPLSPEEVDQLVAYIKTVG